MGIFGQEGERLGVEGAASDGKFRGGNRDRSAGWVVRDLVGKIGQGEEGVDRAAVGERNGFQRRSAIDEMQGWEIRTRWCTKWNRDWGGGKLKEWRFAGGVRLRAFRRELVEIQDFRSRRRRWD